jgi:peptidoglycan/LPS O-acetylase OafA/YrhL
VTTANRITWRSLEALRGVAALLVMALHALHAAPAVYDSAHPLARAVLASFSWGWLGVPVFFVLSGFVLSLPFLAPGEVPPRLGGYLARRVARILPAYWLQVAVVLLGLLLLGGFPGALGTPDPARWPTQLAMAFQRDAGAAPWLGVWWTLPVECAFYLLLPALLAPRLGRARWLLLALLLGAAVVLRGVAGAGLLDADTTRVLAHHLPTRIDLFLVGVLAARLWLGGAALFADRCALAWLLGGTFVIVALVAAVALPPLPMPDLLPRRHWLALWPTLFALGVAALLLGLLAAERAGRRWPAPGLLVGLGTLSYGVYLWHLPVLHALAGLAAGSALAAWPPLLLGMALPPTLLLAWASWRFVEQPARRWVRRRLG